LGTIPKALSQDNLQIPLPAPGSAVKDDKPYGLPIDILNSMASNIAGDKGSIGRARPMSVLFAKPQINRQRKSAEVAAGGAGGSAHIDEKIEARHLKTAAELRNKTEMSSCRDWDNYTAYTSPELEALMGFESLRKNNDLIKSWHARKIEEIMQSIRPVGDEGFMLQHSFRRFMRADTLNYCWLIGVPDPVYLILFNDLMVWGLLNKDPRLVLHDVISMDSLAVGIAADTNTCKKQKN